MASWTLILLAIVVFVFVALTAASMNRLFMMRRGGTAAIVRKLPASPGSRWRHGIIRYGENQLVFFRLSSLRPGPDARVTRQGIEIGSRRRPKDTEFDIMTDAITVITVTDGDHHYEFAMDSGAFTAFMSWVESRPSDRSRRSRP